MNVLNNQHKLQRLKARYQYAFPYLVYANRSTRKLKSDSSPLPLHKKHQMSTRYSLLGQLLKDSLECTKNKSISDVWKAINH